MTNDQGGITDSRGVDSETPRRQRGTWLFIRDIVLILIAALVISLVIKTFFIRSFYIPSGSMENTLEVNDRVIVSLLTPKLVPLKRGDVVVFEDPGGWLGPENVAPHADSPLTDVLAFVGLTAPDDNNHLIKRVIGLPGDKVTCCTATGKLTVNGTALTEPYITLTAGAARSDPSAFSVTVPKGDLWVLGDNRDNSEDSAYHYSHKDASPFVPISDITGEALVISWPISRWTVLSNYPATFANVESPTTK